MSGLSDVTFPQGQQHLMDLPHPVSDGMMSTIFTEEFVQPPSTQQINDTGTSHFGVIDFLGHYASLTTSQLGHLACPPALCAYHVLLNHHIQSGMIMDRPSQQKSFRDPRRLSSEHWPTSLDALQSSEAASSQPGIASSGTATYSSWQPFTIPHSKIDMPHETNTQLSHQLIGTLPPQGSPQSLVDHPTPSSASELFSDQQSSPTASTEMSDLQDGVSQPANSPQSMYRSPSRPRENSNHMPSVPGTQERDRDLSISPPQHENTLGLKILIYNPTLTLNKRKNKRRSMTPCPKCRKSAFESRHEFVKHMCRKHERPVRFVCNHHMLLENGEQDCCPKSEWEFSAWKKHHTEGHRKCTEEQSQHMPLPECRQEIVNPRPVRQRGCWLCNHLSFTVENWVDHHLGEHKACSRSLMSQTWAIKSLLSHPDITFYWQIQIMNLEVTTGYYWDLQWSNDLLDPTMMKLVRCLETGFFKDKNFHKHSYIRAQVAEAAMDATLNTREEIAAIPPQQLIELEAGLNNLRRHLAMAAQSEMELSSHAREVQCAVSSSTRPLFEMRNLTFSWPQSQWGHTNVESDRSGLELGDMWASHIVDGA